MTWFKRRRADAEQAAVRLVEAERRVNAIVDHATRLVRLEADAAIYTHLMKKRGLK